MKVTIVTTDVVGARMAGPGIRAWHMAEELSEHFDVTLVAREGEPIERPVSFDRQKHDTPEAERKIRESDLVVTQPGSRLGGCSAVIYDLFAPVPLELDQVPGGLLSRIWIKRRLERRRLRRALQNGRHLIVATEAQKSFYSDLAASWGIDPAGLNWLTIPFGVPRDPAREPGDTRPGLFVWNGGVWPWLDAETAIKAAKRVSGRGHEITLRFLGASRPGANHSLQSSIAGADEVVEWNQGWVPYFDRDLELGRARAAVMLHRDTPEATYSIRTRFFDALWCGIPVIATRGGWVSDLVEERSLGVVVEPGDVKGVGEAMEVLLEDDDYHSRSVKNLEDLRDDLRWDRVITPLVEVIEESSERGSRQQER